MNKLILLSEIRKGKIKNKLLGFNKAKRESKDSNETYVIFKEKFEYFQNKENSIDIDLKKINTTKDEKKLNEIIKRILLLDNNIPLIEFINFIYDDDLSINTRIEYIEDKDIINDNNFTSIKNSKSNIIILVEDEYRKFGCQIQIETRDDQNIAIIINKINLINNCDNILSFSKKKKEYERDDMDKDSREIYTKCLIMLNCNIEIPDVYEFEYDIDGKNIEYKMNIIKSWKYDFKQLYENKIYLLIPIKVLDLEKRLLSIGQEITSRNLIRYEIHRFFKDMNMYLKKIKDDKLITDEDINELNLIAIDLLNHFIKEKNNILVDIRKDIEATLRNIVV